MFLVINIEMLSFFKVLDGDFVPQSEEAEVVKKQVVLMNVVLNNLRVKIEDLATAGHKVDFDQILRQDFENFRQDHNNLRQEHNNLRVDYNNFRQDHGNLRNEHNRLLEQHDKLRQDYEKLKVDHDHLRNERDNLSSKLESVSQKRDTVPTVATEPVLPVSLPQ